MNTTPFSYNAKAQLPELDDYTLLEAQRKVTVQFANMQPVALDIYQNLERWMPAIKHYLAYPLSDMQESQIAHKTRSLLEYLKQECEFTMVECAMVETVATWALPFLEKQGFQDALDHSIKVCNSSIALCHYMEIPRHLHAFSVLVSLLHDPKINVEPADQMAMLVSHPSLASALMTIFLHPETATKLGTQHIFSHLYSLGEYYGKDPVTMGVSAVCALMENLDSGYVVEVGFVRHLTQLHLQRNTDHNNLIARASDVAIENALELAEYIRMQYLAQLFSTYDATRNEYASPVEGLDLDNEQLDKLTPEIHIRSGFPFVHSLRLSDVFTSHVQNARVNDSKLLGAMLGAADNGQLNGYKVLLQSVEDYCNALKLELSRKVDNITAHWIDVNNRHKLELPLCLKVEALQVKDYPQILINGFVECSWRSIVENYLYLKGNAGNLISLHYVVREGVGFLSTLQRYGELQEFGHLCIESRFGDFACADAWQECLEEIACDEEFLFLLYKEIDNWLSFHQIRWPSGMALDLKLFAKLHKKETELIESCIPLTPSGIRKSHLSSNSTTMVGLYAKRKAKKENLSSHIKNISLIEPEGSDHHLV
jgi:hypothetical protein